MLLEMILYIQMNSCVVFFAIECYHFSCLVKIKTNTICLTISVHFLLLLLQMMVDYWGLLLVIMTMKLLINIIKNVI